MPVTMKKQYGKLQHMIKKPCLKGTSLQLRLCKDNLQDYLHKSTSNQSLGYCTHKISCKIVTSV